MLKGLIGQEALLKQELAAARRNSERADKLNVEYLKNIVLAFLIKVRVRVRVRVRARVRVRVKYGR